MSLLSQTQSARITDASHHGYLRMRILPRGATLLATNAKDYVASACAKVWAAGTESESLALSPAATPAPSLPLLTPATLMSVDPGVSVSP